MHGKMTSKERMLTAFGNKQPDMVPVSPDISNMVPARLTGKPFWDIYFYGDPPLWRAYIEAVKRYRIDGWQFAGHLGPSSCDSATSVQPLGDKDARRYRTEIISQTQDAMVARTYCRTPAGELWSQSIYYRDQPPWTTRKYIKDLESDFEHVEHFFPDPGSLSADAYWEMCEAMGDLGTTGLLVPLPGLHELVSYVDGGFETVAKLYHTKQHLIKEFCRIEEEWIIAYVERGLYIHPEFLMIGASGLLTLQSPRIFRDLSLSTLKRITRMAKEAGIPSHLHACGNNRYLVEVSATETQLSSIEPLEAPPAGDCDLAELKQKFGGRIALKGNINTTRFLMASPEEVERMAKWCIDVAGEGGGYVLSTGDQVGRDTPDQNIEKLVEVARTYGRYPLRRE